MPATSGPCPIFKPKPEMRLALFAISQLEGGDKVDFWWIAQRRAGQGPLVTPGKPSNEARSTLYATFRQAGLEKANRAGRSTQDNDAAIDRIVACAPLLMNALSSDRTIAAEAALEFICQSDKETFNNGERLTITRRVERLGTDFYGRELLGELPDAPPNALFRSLWQMRTAIFRIETVPFNARLSFWLRVKDIGKDFEVEKTKMGTLAAGRHLLSVFRDAARTRVAGAYPSEVERQVALDAIRACAPQLIEALSPHAQATARAVEFFERNSQSLNEPGWNVPGP